MSRDLKFRAWDKINKKMTIDFLIGAGGRTFPVGIAWLGNAVIGQESKNLIPLQYTGLKDKNGVEIYEGDIGNLRLNSCGHLIAPVRYDRGEFIVDSRRYRYKLSNIIHEFKIIGNIYETPDLLKEESGDERKL